MDNLTAQQAHPYIAQEQAKAHRYKPMIEPPKDVPLRLGDALRHPTKPAALFGERGCQGVKPSAKFIICLMQNVKAVGKATKRRDPKASLA